MYLIYRYIATSVELKDNEIIETQLKGDSLVAMLDEAITASAMVHLHGIAAVVKILKEDIFFCGIVLIDTKGSQLCPVQLL